MSLSELRRIISSNAREKTATIDQAVARIFTTMYMEVVKQQLTPETYAKSFSSYKEPAPIMWFIGQLVRPLIASEFASQNRSAPYSLAEIQVEALAIEEKLKVGRTPSEIPEFAALSSYREWNISWSMFTPLERLMAICPEYGCTSDEIVDSEFRCIDRNIALHHPDDKVALQMSRFAAAHPEFRKTIGVLHFFYSMFLSCDEKNVRKKLEHFFSDKKEKWLSTDDAIRALVNLLTEPAVIGSVRKNLAGPLPPKISEYFDENGNRRSTFAEIATGRDEPWLPEIGAEQNSGTGKKSGSGNGSMSGAPSPSSAPASPAAAPQTPPAPQAAPLPWSIKGSGTIHQIGQYPIVTRGLFEIPPLPQPSEAVGLGGETTFEPTEQPADTSNIEALGVEPAGSPVIAETAMPTIAPMPI